MGRKVGGIVAGVCFEGGTLVSTEYGLIPIKCIEQDDLVWAYDAGQDEMVLCRVTQTFAHQASGLVEIEIDVEGPPDSVGGSGSVIIRATDEHPFWVDGRGWIAARDLNYGDPLKTLDGDLATVRGITFASGPVCVYNFEVEGTHNYFVSDEAVLVHNACWKRPPNLSPPGAGRYGAFGQAKRDLGIPRSQQPSLVGPNRDRLGRKQPGREYWFDTPNGPVSIRDDAAGHFWGPNDLQNRGPHFNTPGNNHYDY